MMEATRQEIIEEIDYRARLFQIVAYITLIAGIVFGIGFGAAADQILVGLITGMAAGFIAALPFLGVAWILDACADILEHR